MRTPCLGCGAPTDKAQLWRGRCEKCAPAHNRETRTELDRELQNSREWRALSAAKLRQQPLCEDCLEEDRVVAANQVDHIVARAAGGPLIVPLSGLRSLCASHHSRKTAREDRTPRALPRPKRALLVG